MTTRELITAAARHARMAAMQTTSALDHGHIRKALEALREAEYRIAATTEQAGAIADLRNALAGLKASTRLIAGMPFAPDADRQEDVLEAAERFETALAKFQPSGDASTLGLE